MRLINRDDGRDATPFERFMNAVWPKWRKMDREDVEEDESGPITVQFLVTSRPPSQSDKCNQDHSILLQYANDTYGHEATLTRGVACGICGAELLEPKPEKAKLDAY